LSGDEEGLKSKEEGESGFGVRRDMGVSLLIEKRGIQLKSDPFACRGMESSRSEILVSNEENEKNNSLDQASLYPQSVVRPISPLVVVGEIR